MVECATDDRASSKSRNSLTIAIYLSTCFSGANLISVANPNLSKAIFLTFFAGFIFQNRNKIRFINITSLFLAGLFTIHVLSLSLAEISSGSGALFSVLKPLFFLFCFWLFCLSGGQNDFLKVMKVHYRFCILLALLSILDASLATLGLKNSIPNFSLSDGFRNFICSPLGCAISGSDDGYVRLSNLRFPRIQSFFDEPGTYAFFLIPAILYNIIYGLNFIPLLVLLTAFGLTWSFGAISFLLFTFPLLIFLSFYSSDKKFRVNLWCRIGVLTCLLASIGFIAFDTIGTYAMDKLGLQSGQTHSSFGVRAKEFQLVSSYLSDSFLGTGINKAASLGVSLSSGVLSEIAGGGVLSALTYPLFLIGILAATFRKAISDRAQLHSNILPFIVAISLMTMGLQRMAPTHTLWSLLLMALLVSSSTRKKKCQYSANPMLSKNLSA